jgi:hypothetical protein
MGINRSRRPQLHRRLATAVLAATALAILAALPAATALSATAAGPSNDTWKHVPGKPAESKGNAKAEVKAKHLRAYTLDAARLEQQLAAAPAESRASRAGAVITLPSPTGELQRFAVVESPVMAPGLAAKHPEITTYSGRGLDDKTATVRADVSPRGFHASVRSPAGAWFVDPYYHLDESLYASYFTRDLEEAEDEHQFKDPLSDPDEVAEAIAAEVPVGPAVTLRTYRLALLTDPSYTAYHGGPANVTAAKVTLMNRVNQIYEDETAIRMILIADNDKLNFNTNADAFDPNGPCGLAACFTPSQLSSCTGNALSRNRIVIGQIIGASNYDIGHLALGNPGGGVASLNAVGGNAKAQGCTGLPNPIGDFFAVDYVAHEMGHQFGGNHTFNGTQHNCGGNKAAPSVEPGSGSSIMAYAGICRHDDLQPHSDPYWSQWSFQEITAYVTSSRPAINEVQNASLRDYTENGDAFAIAYGGNSTQPFVRGTNYSAASIQLALQGVSEVQTVALTGYDTNGDSYRLVYGADQSVPIVRGQNNTTAGIAAALQGGNEQQQVSLTGFNAATGSFQIAIGGGTSALLGLGGLAVNNGNVAAAVNAIPGFAGTVSSSGAGNSGFTLTFAGASAATDVPAISIVGCTCTSAVRENVKGGGPLASWPTGATVTVGGLSDAGYTLTFGGSHQGFNVAALSIADANGAGGTVTETTPGSSGMLPPGATATVAGFAGGTFNDQGFQVTFGGTLAGTNTASLELVGFSGASGFVGETAKGGAIDNQGWIAAENGNHAPVVSAPMGYVIPVRTPFALTGSATDSDGDTLTYMWEQKDRGAAAGTALTDNNKLNGPLFRQFGTAALVTPEGTLLTPSPGLNAVGADPTRVFPDIRQILDDNTNAATGACPAFTGVWPVTVPLGVVDCYSEFLPTAAYVGFAGVNAAPASLNFRLTVRDHRPGGGGIGSADTRLTLAPLAGPFLVTSHSSAESLPAGSTTPVTWDVAGTNLPPVGTENVKISLSVDGGLTYPHVLTASTPNDGSAEVELPNVGTAKARIKVEAVDNVYFDVSGSDVAVRNATTQLGEVLAYATGKGPGQSLASKVESAAASYAAGQVGAACSKLNALLHEVAAQSGKSLTSAEADELTRRVGWIRTAIGC